MTRPRDTGYRIERGEFENLLKIASRHHARKISDLLDMTVSRRDGEWLFFDGRGRSVSLHAVHARIQAAPALRRSMYNLLMARFR